MLTLDNYLLSCGGNSGSGGGSSGGRVGGGGSGSDSVCGDCDCCLL